jgi:hypothetical protein
MEAPPEGAALLFCERQANAALHKTSAARPPPLSP